MSYIDFLKQKNSCNISIANSVHGPDGQTGTRGIPGRPGDDGLKGDDGPIGNIGPKGCRGPPGPKGECVWKENTNTTYLEQNYEGITYRDNVIINKSLILDNSLNDICDGETINDGRGMIDMSNNILGIHGDRIALNLNANNIEHIDDTNKTLKILVNGEEYKISMEKV